MAKDEALAEEGVDVLVKDITRGYKFRPLMQIIIVCIVIGVTIIFLQAIGALNFTIEGHLAITTLVFFWVLSFLFPLILQTRGHRANQVSMGLYFASIFSLTATIILLIVTQSTFGIASGSIALLIAFLTGIGSMLFEHLHPDAIGRTTKVYLGIFGVAVVFFICVWFYMQSITAGYGIWIAIVFTALFAYALLPDTPK